MSKNKKLVNAVLKMEVSENLIEVSLCANRASLTGSSLCDYSENMMSAVT